MDSLFLIVITVLVILLIFFAFRELWMWYFKINIMIENQEKQLKELKKQTEIFEELVEELTD